MNLQEMATAIVNNVPVKVLIIDNRALGMVHQWQHLFYHDRYSSTELAPVPDFVALAQAYGWQVLASLILMRSTMLLTPCSPVMVRICWM